MKNLKYIFAAVALSCLGTACNESSWLKETPYDFYTPENSYTTTDQFQNALNYLYDEVRGMHWKMGDQNMALICSDIASMRQLINRSISLETFYPEDTDVWDTAYLHFKQVTMNH